MYALSLQEKPEHQEPQATECWELPGVIVNNSDYTCIKSQADARGSGLPHPNPEQHIVSCWDGRWGPTQNSGFRELLLLKCKPIHHENWLPTLCGLCQHGKVTFVGNYESSTIGNNSGCHHEKKKNKKVICCRKTKIKSTSMIIHI